MTTAAPSTLERWPDLPDRKGYEYLDGRWVRIPLGNESNDIAAQLFRKLADFTERKKLGRAFAHEFGYQIWPNHPARYRKPDGSFIAQHRLTGSEGREPLAHTAPDLAIEVISPSGRGWDVEEKVQEYFDAGVRLVWVVYPRRRSVLVNREDGTAVRLVGDAVLSGEDIIPGFKVKASELFPKPA